MIKKCKSCGENKAVAEFYTRGPNNTPRLDCKSCCNSRAYEWRKRNSERDSENRRAWRVANPRTTKGHSMKHKYGITPDDFDLMMEAQGGLCAICGIASEPPLHIDHCHKTGAVRGLLCGPCNRMIGMAKENPSILDAGADYVRRSCEPQLAPAA